MIWPPLLGTFRHFVAHIFHQKWENSDFYFGNEYVDSDGQAWFWDGILMEINKYWLNIMKIRCLSNVWIFTEELPQTIWARVLPPISAMPKKRLFRVWCSPNTNNQHTCSFIFLSVHFNSHIDCVTTSLLNSDIILIKPPPTKGLFFARFVQQVLL